MYISSWGLWSTSKRPLALLRWAYGVHWKSLKSSPCSKRNHTLLTVCAAEGCQVDWWLCDRAGIWVVWEWRKTELSIPAIGRIFEWGPARLEQAWRALGLRPWHYCGFFSITRSVNPALQCCDTFNFHKLPQCALFFPSCQKVSKLMKFSLLFSLSFPFPCTQFIR